MRYLLVANVYEQIENTTKRLEMTDYLVDLFKKTPKALIDKVVYLTQGKIYPDFMGIEIGMAEKLVIRAIARAAGRLYRETIETADEKLRKGQITEDMRNRIVSAARREFEKELEDSNRKYLEEVQRMAEQQDVKLESVQLKGSAHNTIISEQKKRGADLVIIGGFKSVVDHILFQSIVTQAVQ